MTKKDNQLTVVNEKALAELRAAYPVERGFARIQLPRLSMVSQDQTEGKGKTMKVVVEAGTFFSERETKETDEQGKKIWEKEEIGTGLTGIILYQRKQLKYYDAATEMYTSSPIYDTDDQVIKLFSDKKEVDSGTPAELKSREKYQGLTAAGKKTSKLEENRILYILYKGEIYQMNLRGTSMYAFLTYARKTIPNTVVTEFGSEPKEKGSTNWNQMTFEVVRPINNEEVVDVLEKIKDIKDAITQEQEYYSNNSSESIDDIQKELKSGNF